VFVGQEYDFLVDREPQVIVDAGANIGLASVYFANKYPGAKIIAVEPERGNFELLQKNVAPYPHVTPVHAALWNRNEEISLVDPGLGDWGFMTEAGGTAGMPTLKPRHLVQALTIDRIMKDHQLERIDILKVDIEGAEKEVFSDTANWLDRVDSIIIELHERLKVGCNRSFYCGSTGFDQEWSQGENVYLTRSHCLVRRPS
jgi:FkbM family methyltransferase